LIASAEPTDLSALKEELIGACGAAFDKVLPPEGELPRQTLSEIESTAGGLSRLVGTLLIKNRLRADPLARPDREFPCPKCGRRMRTQEREAKRTLETILGNVELVRPYCVCDACHFAAAPLDYALAIPRSGPSVSRRELICHAATTARSFEKGTATLSHHSKLHMTPEGVRKHAEREGRKLVEASAKRVEACFKNRGRTPRAPAQAVPLLVVTCDGGSVQTRDKLQRWKEDKIGCVYDAEPLPEPRAPTAEKYRGAKARTKTYVATMEPWASLGPMLFVEACIRGYLAATAKLFISDAANGIMALYAEHFPDAMLIIDWYHAAKHLSKCAKAAFPTSPAQCTKWFETQKARLWEGQVCQVIEAIRNESERVGRPPPKTPDTDPRVVLSRDLGYFSDHQEAMDYPAYRANGWPIGSGVAEGSVKQFGQRVKGSEQFWNVWGAEEMLALCALQHSEDDRWAMYWKERSTPPADAGRFYTSTH